MQGPSNHLGFNLDLPHVAAGQNGSPAGDLTASTLVLTDGDREQLVLQHLETVRFIARRIRERMPQHVDLDDLVSAGLIGLLDAASKFDWRKQVQFKSYAQFRIRGAILDSLRELDWSPRELRRKGRAVAEATRTLSARFGRVPTQVEVAEELGLDLAALQQLAGELDGLELGSLNEERGEDLGDEELDFVPAPQKENPLLRCIEAETQEQLAAAIELLPEKERLVLSLYYHEELTMKEIGLTLGVVESRVSQLRASAVQKLRATLTRRPAERLSAQALRRMN